MKTRSFQTHLFQCAGILVLALIAQPAAQASGKNSKAASGPSGDLQRAQNEKARAFREYFEKQMKQKEPVSKEEIQAASKKVTQILAEKEKKFYEEIYNKTYDRHGNLIPNDASDGDEDSESGSVLGNVGPATGGKKAEAEKEKVARPGDAVQPAVNLGGYVTAKPVRAKEEESGQTLEVVVDPGQMPAELVFPGKRVPASAEPALEKEKPLLRK